MKTCVTCGQQFEYTHAAQRYCGEACKPVRTYKEIRDYFNERNKARLMKKRQGRACLCCGAPIPDTFSLKAKYCGECRGSHKVRKMNHPEGIKRRFVQKERKTAPVGVWKCVKCGSDKRRAEGNSVYCGSCFWHVNEVGDNVRKTNNRIKQQTGMRNQQ